MASAESFRELDQLVGIATTIVCDWNGTIVDDADRALAATNRTLAEFGLPTIDDARFRDAFCLPLREFVRRLGISEGDRDLAIEHWNRSLATGETRLQPGVRELLETARRFGVAVGIVSAAEEAVVRRDAVALGIAGDLAFIAGAAASKSAALAEIAARAGGPIIYAGDTEYDILEANRAGVAAIGFGGGYRPAPALLAAGPLLVIDDFALLAAALRRVRSRESVVGDGRTLVR